MALDALGDVVRSLLGQVVPAVLEDLDLPVGPAVMGSKVLARAGRTGPKTCSPVVIGLTLVFAGLLPVAAVGADIVLGAAPPERAGAASAISETTQELGLALGIAVLGSIATAVYRAHLSEAVPAGVAADAAQVARDTLGGAAGVADQLPDALLAAAADAFTSGVQLAAVVSAVALAGVALVSGVVLWRGPAGPEPDGALDGTAHPAEDDTSYAAEARTNPTPHMTDQPVGRPARSDLAA